MLLIGIVTTACNSEPADTTAQPHASPKETVLTAASLGEQELLTNEEYLRAPMFAEADQERGEKLFLQCRACHTIGSGEGHTLGPNLHGIFGQTAGKTDGFAFSPAFLEAQFAWTPRAMDAWIYRPYSFLPANRMSFAGISNADDRRDLIAYLLQNSGD